jgi:hypothetical protein
VALVGETVDQVREVMIFGDSGILACSPLDRRPKWSATRTARDSYTFALPPSQTDIGAGDTVRLNWEGGTTECRLVPAIWPAGARFVLLSAATEQLDLPASSVGVARTYRFGPANKGYSDPSYTEITLGFDGAGLRPYPPCHLAVEADSVGGLQLKWIRRTRISGDSWSGLDVPIGEESEMYEIAAQQGGIVKYRGMTTQPNWTATAALLATDFDSTPITFSVAQISAIYGVGPATQITTL